MAKSSQKKTSSPAKKSPAKKAESPAKKAAQAAPVLSTVPKSAQGVQ